MKLTSITFGWSKEEYERLFPQKVQEQKEEQSEEKTEPLTPSDQKESRHLGKKDSSRGYIIFNKIIGILVSGLLISFGAPFWHDLLNAMTGMRGKVREATTGKARA